MRRGFTLQIVCLLALLLMEARATTRAKTQGPSPSESSGTPQYCEVEGKFLAESNFKERIVFRGRAFDESRVYWAIELSGAVSTGEAECPSGQPVEVRIRGASHAVYPDGSAQYVYPVHITPPKSNQRIQARLKKQHVRDPRNGAEYYEWLITDWNDGFKTVSD